MHWSARHINKSMERRSYFPLPLLDATESVPSPIDSMVFIIIFILLRGVGLGRCGNTLPQLYHEFVQRIAPSGTRRYKTGQELTLWNHCCPHRSFVLSQWCHTRYAGREVVISPWVRRLRPCSRCRGFQRMKYGNIQTSLFKNGNEGIGMGICRYAAISALVAGGEGGGKRPAKKYTI